MTTQSLSSAPASSSTIAFSNRDYNAAQIYSSPHAPRGPYLPPPHHSPSPLGGSITIPTDSAPASPVPPASGAASPNLGVQSNGRPAAKTSRSKPKAQVAPVAGTKRRCVSNACVACRKRKSKCDGNVPSCAACASVYKTECVYDPNSDHRRKGVYKKNVDSQKTRSQTLQILMQAILNFPEDQAWKLFQEIRTCESLEAVADSLAPDGNDWAKKPKIDDDFDGMGEESMEGGTFEAELSGKMAQLRMDGEGSVKFVGATSNLALLPSSDVHVDRMGGDADDLVMLADRWSSKDSDAKADDKAIQSWTTVTQDADLIKHLVRMYFTWHYPYFTCLSRELFEREFYAGHANGTPDASPSPAPSAANAPSPASSTTSSGGSGSRKRTRYCSPLLVNAILALGCHFTSHPGARALENDPNSKGDHFFKEAKHILLDCDEHEIARLTTVQALALMSVREAGCGRESRGWFYSGMSFRMVLDMGLHHDVPATEKRILGEKEIDARRVTFWGCFLFDKCWSNYLGRKPQLSRDMAKVPKYDVIPDEDSQIWRPYTNNGESFTSSQPARTRAIGLQISALCEISDEILSCFYCEPAPSSKEGRKDGNKLSRDLKNLSDLWKKLEDWKKKLPKELHAREGSLPPVLLMHMFHQLLYIHLFRPFLKHSSQTTPSLSHLDPKKVCLSSASTISKYLRFYKREYGLRQICNVAVYIILSACTIHLINHQDLNARRDILQALQALEEVGQDWLCAKRAILIFKLLVRRWRIELPQEAKELLDRCREWDRFPDLGYAKEEEVGTDVEMNYDSYLQQDKSDFDWNGSETVASNFNVNSAQNPLQGLNQVSQQPVQTLSQQSFRPPPQSAQQFIPTSAFSFPPQPSVPTYRPVYQPYQPPIPPPLLPNPQQHRPMVEPVNPYFYRSQNTNGGNGAESIDMFPDNMDISGNNDLLWMQELGEDFGQFGGRGIGFQG